MKNKYQELLIALLVLLVGAVFISPESFWIDEGNTAYKASQNGLSQWFHAMHATIGSDSQMPGYMFYIWAWEKLVPHSEFFLRLSNLPWLLLLVFALRRSPFALVFAITSPFILFYLSELRPYLMQLAGAALAVRGLGELDTDKSKAWITILWGCLIMCLASLIGVVWSLGALIYVVVNTPTILKSSSFWKGALCFASPFGVLAAYYAWTLANGQEAAMMGGGLAVSLGACAYELLGLAGLGPGKLELRNHPAAILNCAFIVIPAFLTVSGLTLIGTIKWLKLAPRRQILAASAAFSLSLGILLTLVIFKDFRLLGRHLAPLAILLVLLCALAISFSDQKNSAPSQSGWPNLIRLCAFIVVVFGIASSLSLRFAERHRKDDYREAARIALHAMKEGRPVIWIADQPTGYSYGLNEKHVGWQPWRQNLPIPSLQGNECVLLSKPDIYDSKAAFATLLREQQFTPVSKLTAFTIYERTAATQPKQ